MTSAETAKPHQDNLFGVCNALGEDLGFNPLYLRLALAVAFLFSPVYVIAGYFAVGLIVLATHLAIPKAQATTNVTRLETAPAPEEIVELARAA